MIMKNLRLFLLLSVFVLTASCQKGSDDPADVQNPLVTGEAQSTMFSAKLSGSFGEKYTVRELSMGKVGFVYIEKSDDSYSSILDWCDKVDGNGCKFVVASTPKSRECSAVIKNLSHSTEYDYCLFFESEDGVRTVGDMCTVKTLPFEPDCGAEGDIKTEYIAVNGHYYVNVDANDMACCEVGVELLDDSDSIMSRVMIKKTELSNDGKFMSYQCFFRYGKTYKTRVFLKHTVTGEIAYGKTSDIVVCESSELGKVDLGLSVMWADRSIGYQYEYSYDGTTYYELFSSYYTWGAREPGYYGVEDYQYWNKETHSYIELGKDISGTEYDAVHYCLGGKWRMPRKEEFDELLNATTCKYAVKDDWTGISFKSTKNGNALFMRTGSYWTSTMSDEVSEASDFPEPWYFIVSYDDMNIPDCYVISYSPRYYDMALIPVWDPGME